MVTPRQYATAGALRTALETRLLERSRRDAVDLHRLRRQVAFDRLLAEKRARREREEAEKPLEAYRAEELERMRLGFYGFDPSYHVARWRFITREPIARTPLHLARHRLLNVP